VKLRYIKWAVAAAVLALLIFVVFRFDWWALVHSLGRVPAQTVVLLLVLQVATQLLVNLQWWQVARHAKVPLSYGKMLYINCQGTIVDAITPGVKFGGEVTRAVRISQAGECSHTQAASVVAVQKLFSLGALFLVGAVYVPLLAAGFLCICVVFVVPKHMMALLQRKKSRFNWAAKLQAFLLEFLLHVIVMRKQPLTCIRFFALAAIIWLIYPLKMYILTAQVAPCVGLIRAGGVAIVSYMVAMIPVFPGGLGGFEGAMTGLLVYEGVYAPDAFAVAVLFRAVTFWFVVGVSVVGVAYLSLQAKRSNPE